MYIHYLHVYIHYLYPLYYIHNYVYQGCITYYIIIKGGGGTHASHPIYSKQLIFKLSLLPDPLGGNIFHTIIMLSNCIETPFPLPSGNTIYIVHHYVIVCMYNVCTYI